MKLMSRRAVDDSSNDLTPDKVDKVNAENDLIHDTTQKFINKTMLYHLDSTALQQLVRQKKPKVESIPTMKVADAVPTEMGDNLKSSLKLWLKETYARAYVGRMLYYAHLDVKNQLKQESQTTNEEGKKLRH